jgi:hypothetical protein
MAVSFRDLVPAAEPGLQRLSELPLIKAVNESVWIFASIETVHLLSLAILGGAVLVLALRLLGLVLTEAAPAEVERRTRPWLHAGVAGTVATGVIMGIINSATLYGSAAFFVKMVALIGAILISYVVVREVAQQKETATPAGVVIAVAALAVWAFALFLFVTTPRVNPGAVLIVAAGVALLAATARRRRGLLLGGLAAILLVGWVVTHVVLSPDDDPARIASANIGFVAAAALFTLGIGAFEIRDDGRSGEAPAKLAAFASTLAWVTVAAAGRWIGFS